MTSFATSLALGAGLALALCASASAAEAPAKTGAVAYPDNPNGTPAATTATGTAPAASSKPDCPDGKCADSPPPSAKADTASQGADTPEPGKVDTPAAAYPNAPAKTPASGTNGTAPN